MRRFIADSQTDNFFKISGDELHHLSKVLRLQVGEKIEIASSENATRYLCKISEIEKNFALAEIEQELEAIETPAIHLVCANPKPKIADFIVEKSVELGLKSLSFFTAERSQGKQDLAQRQERFEKVAAAAFKQSGYHQIDIRCQESLESVLKQRHSEQSCTQDGEWRYILSTQEGAKKLKELAFSGPVQKNSISADSYLVIGPEGGLSIEEEKLLKSFSYNPASLGEKILRVETAVIAACALVSIARS